MLFEKLLQQPVDSPALLLRESIYDFADQTSLVRDVMALANAHGGSGARHILFGVQRNQEGRPVFSKLPVAGLQGFEHYAEIIRQFVEPDLRVAPLVGDIQGNIVAALEISHFTNPPYLLKTDVSMELRRGACWVREGGLLRPAQRADLDRMYRFAAGNKVSNGDDSIIRLGFGADPNQKTLRLELPEITDPPSKLAASRMKAEIDAQKFAAERNVMDTSVQRLIHARLFKDETDFHQQGIDTMVEGYNAVMDRYADQDNYYYFETNAVRMNPCIVNTGHEALENVSLMLTLPCAEEFRVADRLYPPPDKSRSARESELLGYPKVKVYDKAVQVKYHYDRLEPDAVVAAFEKDLRIAVQPQLAGKKVSVRFSVQAEGLERPETGKLRLVFGRKS